MIQFEKELILTNAKHPIVFVTVWRLQRTTMLISAVDSDLLRVFGL